MINFENCPVTIKGVSVFANSASISQSLPIENLQAFGVYGAAGSYPTEPPNGNVSVDFYISGANDVDTFLDLRKSGYADTLGNFISVSIGPFEIDRAVLTNYTLSAEPNNLLTASVSLDYYGNFSSGAAPAQQFTTGSFGHGGFSTGLFATFGFSDAPFSFSYSLDQTFQPIRGLASALPEAVLWTNGSETLSFDGYDLPKSLTGSYSATASDWLFPTGAGLTFAIKNICDVPYATIGVTGDLTARNISVSENNVVNGSLTVVNEL